MEGCLCLNVQWIGQVALLFAENFYGFLLGFRGYQKLFSRDPSPGWLKT